MSSSSEGGRGGGGETKGSFNKSNTINVLPRSSPLSMCLHLGFIQPCYPWLNAEGWKGSLQIAVFEVITITA